MSNVVLLVEDEDALRLFVGDSLRKEGYSVEYAADGDEAFDKATTLPINIVVLDVMLPKRNGFDVCAALRAAGISVPIIMLTARSRTEDAVAGLRIGADDYVTKPFSMPELMARVAALLRRATGTPKQQTNAYEFGSVRVDFRGTAVMRDGKPVSLSAREFQLLRFMIENRGATLTREVLLKEVWGYTGEMYTRTVDVRIGSLRHQLEEDPRQPRFILTVQGVGYKFIADERDSA